MGRHDHAGGKSHQTEKSNTAEHSTDKDNDAGGDGVLSRAMSGKAASPWTDPDSVGTFLDDFAFIWNSRGKGADLADKQTDPTMRAALSNLVIVVGYLRDAQGTAAGQRDYDMVKLALQLWDSSVRNTLSYAFSMYGSMAGAHHKSLANAKSAYADVIDEFATLYEYGDQEEAEKAGTGGSLTTLHESSQLQLTQTVEALEKGMDLAKKAGKTFVGLMGDDNFAAGYKKITAIYTLLTGPGDLEEKLKKSDGALQTIKTIDELLQYAATLLQTFTTSVFSAAALLESGESKKFLEGISKDFGKWIGKGVSILQIVASALDCVDKISKGDWAGARDAAITGGQGLLTLLVPEAAVPLGAAALWWFELKGSIDAAGEFLSMIGDIRKHDAVQNLLGPARQIAPSAHVIGVNLQAWSSRVADTSLDPEVRQTELMKLKTDIDSEAGAITNELARIHKQLAGTDDYSVGAYSDLMAGYEVGAYNGAAELKTNPNALTVGGWNPPAITYDRDHLTDMPGFVRSLLRGVQQIANVAAGDAPEQRTVRLTELQRIDGTDDLIPGGTAKILMPINADGGNSVIEVTDVRLDSDDNALQVINQDYPHQLKGSGFADASDEIDHPLEVKFSPKGYGPVTGTLTVTAVFPDGHSEIRTLKITGMN